MFDFWRNLRKSKAEKERDLLHAYVDQALSPAERAQFEARLAQEPDLQAEVEAVQQVKQMLATVPRRRVPRNFTLDPARYGRPASQPLLQAYPALRMATALTAVIFVIILALDWGVPGLPQADFFEAQMVEEAAMEEVAMDDGVAMDRMVEEALAEMEEPAVMLEEEEPPPAAAPLPEAAEATRVVTETITEDAPVVERATMTPTHTIPARTRTPTAVVAPTAVVVGEIETAVTEAITTDAEITAVSPVEPEARLAAVTNRQWLQLGVGAVLALLLTLLFFARRQASV